MDENRELEEMMPESLVGALRASDVRLGGDLSEVPADRRGFFEGMAMLARGEVREAVRQFRRAQRRCEAPFDALAGYALGECQRLDGKEGAALRAWQKVADDEELPATSRAFALMAIAAAEERRGNERGLVRAREQLDALELGTAPPRDEAR